MDITERGQQVDYLKKRRKRGGNLAKTDPMIVSRS
jgi:hypothetical protein